MLSGLVYNFFNRYDDTTKENSLFYQKRAKRLGFLSCGIAKAGFLERSVVLNLG
jgi:hypothetical protein